MSEFTVVHGTAPGVPTSAYMVIEIGEPGAGEGGTLAYNVVAVFEKFEDALADVALRNDGMIP